MQPDTSVVAINKGEIHRMEFLDSESLMERLTDANNLVMAFNNSQKNVAWKESVQRYEANLLRNVNRTVKVLNSGKYIQKPFYEFPLFERDSSAANGVM